VCGDYVEEGRGIGGSRTRLGGKENGEERYLIMIVYIVYEE
jgi:hypothetical protein